MPALGEEVLEMRSHSGFILLVSLASLAELPLTAFSPSATEGAEDDVIGASQSICTGAGVAVELVELIEFALESEAVAESLCSAGADVVVVDTLSLCMGIRCNRRVPSNIGPSVKPIPVPMPAFGLLESWKKGGMAGPPSAE
jgi:hypothetical protein